MARVAVIGAGVGGLVSAARLVSEGFRVEVFDRAATLGAGAASWLAGGMLAPFCEAETADTSIIGPGLSSIEWWEKAVPGVERNGTLVVAPWRDRADLSRFARRTSRGESIGQPRLAELEPALEGRFSDALMFAEEAHLDPRKAMGSLVSLLDEAGASLTLGEELSTHDLEEAGNYDALVDARGIFARETDPDLRAVRGEMLIVQCEAVSLSRPVRLLHPRSPIYIVPRENHHFMIGATTIETADPRGITLRGTVELLNAAYALHPAFAEAEIVETGAGLRPAYRDNLPRVTRKGRTVSINGFYRHGFLLAPSLAVDVVAAVKEITMSEGYRRFAS